MTHLKNFLIKREQSQACLSFAKREKSRLLAKLMMTLALLLTAVGGAWADETLLMTIVSTDYQSFYSGSMTFDDKVTVTFSDEVNNGGTADGWYATIGGSLLTVAGTNGYTITSCKFYTADGPAATGYTVEGESPSVYLLDAEVYADANKSVFLGYTGIKKIEVYGAAASSGPEVAWDKAKNTGTFTMPGGNVTLEPEYYPQAALTAAPTAINDVPATTDGAIVNAGTVKNIGETTTAQGTVMYYVSTTALDDAALLALAADAWTADVPTAESLAQGQAYVYYYVRGNDSDTDETTFSDGDILSANALTVTIAAAPTYAVTFADDMAEPDKWTADPNAGVKKGQQVTVTYTGTKKIIGVKAEKKAAAAAAEGHALSASAVGEIVGSDGKAYAVADKDNLPEGVTAVAMIAYVGSDTYDATFKNGLAIALADEEGSMNWSTAMSTCEGKTAIMGAKWCLPSQDQWKQMFKVNGGNKDSYTGLNTTITTAGGTTLQESVGYWSSSEEIPGSYAKYVYLYEGNAGWTSDSEGFEGPLARACLAF